MTLLYERIDEPENLRGISIGMLMDDASRYSHHHHTERNRKVVITTEEEVFGLRPTGEYYPRLRYRKFEDITHWVPKIHMIHIFRSTFKFCQMTTNELLAII